MKIILRYHHGHMPLYMLICLYIFLSFNLSFAQLYKILRILSYLIFFCEVVFLLPFVISIPIIIFCLIFTIDFRYFSFLYGIMN